MTSAVFSIWHSTRAQRSDSRTFFGPHLQYIWQEDVAKIPEVPGVPRNVNLAQE